MKKARAAVLVGAGMLAAGGVYWGISRKIMKVILGRTTPKLSGRVVKLVSGSDLFTEYGEEISLASRKLEEQGGFETVKIMAPDGVELVGHFHPHPNPKRVILAFHGWRSGWSRDFGFIADFWFDRGCSVLFLEQRGQNNSGGAYIGFGMLERHDCAAWARWMHRRTGGRLPLYLAGISMGATTVLMASDLELPPSVKGILADCGFTSPHAIWKHVTEKNLHIPFLLQGIVANEICKKELRIGSKECSTQEALRNTKIPVLFFHGTDDKFVPVEMTYENYKATASPKRLLVVPGAQHGMSYHVDRPGYQKATDEFFQEFDGV